VPLRVVIFGVKRNPRYPDAEEVPDTVLINPVIAPLGEEMEEAWEGCLSVPACAAWCRASSACITGASTIGQSDRSQRRGFHARVVQHECDHLDGILYPMRIRDMSQFGFVEVLFPDQELIDD